MATLLATTINGALTVGNTTSSDIYMVDTDNGTRRIHCNSDRIGFLNQSNGWGAYCDDAGNWYSDYSIRAPIFYDSDNTGYYLDPASTSNLNGLTVGGSSVVTNNGGTWGISISGNANYATYSSYLNTLGSYIWSQSSPATDYHLGITSAFVSSGQGFIDYGSMVTVRTYSGGGGTLQLYTPYSTVYGGSRLVYRSSDYNTGAWTGWKYLLNSSSDPYAYNMDQYVRTSDSPTFASATIAGHYHGSYNGNNVLLRTSAAGGDAGILVQNASGNFKFQIYGNGSDYGFLNGNWASWDIRKTANGNLYLNGESTYYYGQNTTYMYRVYGTADMRSPIYYDLDDTNYYLDPNSLSNIKRIQTQQAWYDNSATDWGGGINLKGSTSTVGWQSADQSWWYMMHHSSNNMNFYRRSTSGGWNQDGIWYADGRLEWRNNYLQSNVSMRAPIFYDSDDTTYYADFANSGRSVYTAGYYQSSNMIMKGSAGGGQIYPTVSNGGMSLYGGDSLTNGAWFTVTGLSYGSSPGAGSAEFVIRDAATSKFAMFSYNGSTYTGRYSLWGSTGNVTIGSATTDYGYKLYVLGDIYATGNVTAYSDARVKRNIREIENPLDRIMKSRGVVYDRSDIESNNNIGFIAQELEEQFPELVSTSSDGRKGVMYQNMVAVLLEAVKEQQKQIDELKAKLN